MKRQVILRAAGIAIDSAGNLDPGTSPYGWQNTPNVTLFDAWNDADNASFAYCWPDGGAQHAVTFEKGPTLARFDKVTITTGFDYQQSGPNNWWFPPDNAHGPGCAIMLRKRDLATWLVGTGAAAYQFTDSDPNNVNVNTEPGVFKLYTLTWEMSAHPEGGPWTLEDINDLAVGVEFNWSNGPNGKAYDPAGGSFFKIRAPYLTVTLDIEDLGGFVSNVRHGASLTLRLMRRARNVIRSSVLAEHTRRQIGSRVYLSHPRGPAVGGAGWGRRRLERRPGMILSRTYLPESRSVADEVLDLRPIACLGWAAYRIDGAWSPELQGLALLDKGRGITHVRAQDAWSSRPGDGVLMRVLEHYPNLSSEGLAVSGGGDVATALYNFDLMQSGWSTYGDAGSFSAAADTTVAMAEEQGYLSSCRLTYGSGGGTGGRQRFLGSLAAGHLHVRIVVRNTSVPSPGTQCAEWYLTRGAGEYWNAAARTWDGSPVYNPIPSDEPVGEVIADAIPVTATTYAIGVGRWSSNMGPVTIHGALVDVQHTDATVAGARPPIVTLGSTIERVEDSHQMPHVWGRELWVHERGTAVVEVRPWWRATDLPDDAVKPLLHAQHATDTWDALQFVAVAGDDDIVRFERGISGEGTYRLDCPIPGVDLTRAHVLRAWARWLGSEGWTEYGPYSVEVGYAVFLEADGSLLSTGSVLGRLSSETAVPFDRDYLGIGCDETRQLDGWVRMWETRLSPLHRLESVWRV
jgi:hypothetical protein